MNTNEHKTRAAEMGLEWPAVLSLYREARQLEAHEVERLTELRARGFAACSKLTGGRFKLANREAFTTGDATMVRGIDVAAADMGLTADELYEVLKADAPALRPADDVMAEVIDRAAELAAAADDAEEMVGLVAAAAAADITEQWLRQLVKSGKIRGRKAGRNWIVSRADVAFFARHPTAGRPRREAAPF
jgi:hypothetical protein